ncbi:hypothetical protein FF125_10450 [Aureibaculum algae]|uniref:Uncharacterized protein n=1 Tax=Aureibaculum algae TaxID=2584122 RepID=A0A5B7TUB8_9FLAO|nr:hypothetical protein [Aureibaculum algae]QCX38833.1 hypothetical protein FF125_10450 [Aureibaculum algae]
MKQLKLITTGLKYLMFVPLLMFINCDNSEEMNQSDKNMVQGDANVLRLMVAAVSGGSDATITKSSTTYTTSDSQCTMFQYPISFLLNVEDPQEKVINSDEELTTFINSLTSLNYVGFYFPITLTDYEGNKTQLDNLDDLEGTLELAVEVCSGADDNSDSDSDNSSDTDTDVNQDDNDGSDNGYTWCDKNQKKVSVCHNGNNICISVNALYQHLSQHSDCYLGPCD